LLGGLWHGASWNFAVWGLLHGVALALQRAVQVYRNNAKPSVNPVARFVRIFITIQFVCFAWIFFRAPNFQSAMSILERIGSLTFSTANISGAFALILFLGIFFHFAPKRTYEFSLKIYSASPAVVQAAALALLVLAIQYVAATGSAPFIYTKF